MDKGKERRKKKKRRHLTTEKLQRVEEIYCGWSFLGDFHHMKEVGKEDIYYN